MTDAELVLQVPSGHKFTMLFIAYVKYVIANFRMKAGEHLQLLEWLNGTVDIFITSDVLAMIEPMDTTQAEMLMEARSLDDPKDKLANASFDVLTSERVFWHFVTLNQSLLDAIRFREMRGSHERQ
ncbi:MAG TPA: hypothetical protein VL048_03710 [Xanthobacteraceae bacterium]|nr:hypothetical protein [Xanthobacteraceae bacterium]